MPRRTLTAQEREDLQEIDDELRRHHGRMKAGEITLQEFTRLVEPLWQRKGMILMTVKDIKRTSQGLYDE